MQTVWLDIRHAVRIMRQSRGVTAIAVLSLALAIGVNASVFSLLNAVVLRPLPAPRPHQLVALETVRPNGTEGGFSFPAFEAFAARPTVFSSVIGYFGDGIFNVQMHGTLVRGDIWAVTGNFYSELGVQPFAGRLLSEHDVRLESRAPEMVAVLGYGIWRREFGGALDVIGQPVLVEGHPFTVVGIAPPGFTGIGVTSEPDVTIPLTAAPLLIPGSANRFTSFTSRWVSAIGRLHDGKTLTDARAQLDVMWTSIREATLPPGASGKERDDHLATRLQVTSAASGKEWFLRTRFTTPLYVILAVGGLILLIACVNLASLTLSRAAARAHEVSVRFAIGASRSRIARQMMTEGLVVSGLAAAGGLLLAGWSSRALATMMTRDYLVPVALDVSPDARVLAFTAIVAVAAGVLFSVVPAWRMTRQDPAATLQQHGRALTASGRLGKALIVAQVALSIVLLMDAGLLVRTFGALRAIDPGFEVDRVRMATLFPQPDGYRNIEADRYYPELIERLRAVPGVQQIAMTRLRPGSVEPKQAVAGVESPAGDGVPADFGRVGPDYFEVLDIPLLQGRAFAWSDNGRAPRGAVLSRSLAARLYPAGDAIGRHIRIGTTAARQDLEVVGIVADARLFNPRDTSVLAVYVPLLQETDPGQWSDIIFRSGAPPADVDLRRAVQSLGRESIQSYRPLQRLFDRAILQERVTAMLGGFFGALALALAAIGLYGLMAFGVAQRRKEIAIRVALGSPRGEVVRMVIRDALTLVVIGLAIGIPLALVSGRLVASLLFGLTPTDPVTLAATAASLLTIGAIGGYIPGRKASRVNPVDALRS